MARTLLNGPENISTGTLTRALLNTATSGSAVIAKVIAGTNMSLASTGADAGTGDVTINLNPSANIKLVAGTTTVAPLTFQSGTNLTTAGAGNFEYDGKVFYSTPTASARGVSPSVQLIIAQSAVTLISQTGVQQAFTTPGGGAITLAVGTYEVEWQFALTGMSATSGSFGFDFQGTAAYTYYMTAEAVKAPLATATAPTLSFNTAANTAIAAASTSTTGTAKIRGLLMVTGAGSIVPEVSLGVAAAASVAAGSFCTFTPLGAATVTSVGRWA